MYIHFVVQYNGCTFGYQFSLCNSHYISEQQAINYRPQTNFSKVIFSQVFVCPQGSLSGGSLSGGISVLEVSVRETLHVWLHEDSTHPIGMHSYFYIRRKHCIPAETITLDCGFQNPLPSKNLCITFLFIMLIDPLLSHIDA